MKRNVLIAAIAAAVLSTGALAYGGFGPKGYGSGYGMGPGMMRGGGPGTGMGAGACMGAEAMASLNLSAEQRDKIATIQQETSRKQLELMASMHELRNQAFRSAEPGPGGSYEAMADLRKQMFELTQQARERVDAVLTPEQRTQWGPGWRGNPWRG
jgi:Spy/CpxP family protein refolding chaperone